MDKEEREIWERLTEEEKAKRLLTNYELQVDHYRRARNWLIVVCVVLAITCGIFVQKWQEEKTFRVVAQAFAEYYKQDSEHYSQLYYDCLRQDRDSSEGGLTPTPWWE